MTNDFSFEHKEDNIRIVSWQYKNIYSEFSNAPYFAKQANNISIWLANGQYWKQRTSVY